MAEQVPAAATRGLDYLLVLDFEATCDDGVKMKNEIIEWPCIVLEVQGRKIGPVFHQYVRPTELPTLSAFCTDLTGIEQATVDPAQPIASVLRDFCKFVEADERLVMHPDGSSNFAIVTCGDWDIRTALRQEAQRKNLPLPAYLTQWVNIKHVFQDATGSKGKGMAGMLTHLGLTLDGRHHSGIDDTRNIAKIAATLLDRGAVFHVTGRL